MSNITAVEAYEPEVLNPETTSKEKCLSNMALLNEVEITLEVKLGEITMDIGKLMSLQIGDVIALDEKLNEQVTLMLNKKAVARGALVVSGAHFGVQITHIEAE